MNVIFCSDDFDRRKPDEAYASEVAAVERVGGRYSLVNFDALVNDGDAAKAVRRVPESPEPSVAIYRGWMLKPSAYSRLYEALAAKGLRLVNDQAACLHCHYLPESYSVILLGVHSRYGPPSCRRPKAAFFLSSSEHFVRRRPEINYRMSTCNTYADCRKIAGETSHMRIQFR